MLESCINTLCDKAKVYGYEIKELEHAELTRFFRMDMEEGNAKAYGIVGYKPDYDIRDDYWHPRDGYYHTVLLVKEGNIKKQEPYYK